MLSECIESLIKIINEMIKWCFRNEIEITMLKNKVDFLEKKIKEENL